MICYIMIIRECCYCHTIELNGEYIPFGAPKNNGNRLSGNITHTYFSRKCFNESNKDSEFIAKDIEFELKECPTLKNYLKKENNKD